MIVLLQRRIHLMEYKIVCLKVNAIDRKIVDRQKFSLFIHIVEHINRNIENISNLTEDRMVNFKTFDFAKCIQQTSIINLIFNC